MEDKGEHYRYTYRIKVTEKDLEKGFINIKLDPFRISAIYNPMTFAQETVLKKILVPGGRGRKSYKDDIEDCISALERELEMLEEDKINWIEK